LVFAPREASGPKPPLPGLSFHRYPASAEAGSIPATTMEWKPLRSARGQRVHSDARDEKTFAPGTGGTFVGSQKPFVEAPVDV
jgi:hypothetical protein